MTHDNILIFERALTNKSKNLNLDIPRYLRSQGRKIKMVKDDRK